MLRAMSTYIAVKERLHPGLLDSFVRGGAQTIEIFAAKGHFDYTNRSQVTEIARWFKSESVQLNSMHSPMFADTQWGRNNSQPISIAETDKRQHIAAVDEIKRALEVAEVLPFRFLVQHIGGSGESFSDRKFDAAMNAVEHLRAFAKPLGVNVLVENIPNDLSTPEKLVELIRVAHFQDVGVCFDFGHAHIMNTVARDFETVKDLVRSTHVHDNNRDRDAHLWPGSGGIDWKEAIDLLRSAHHAPAVLMEIEGQEQEQVDVPAAMAKAFNKLEVT
jgi:sugar phosphate isomerase/epimerase